MKPFFSQLPGANRWENQMATAPEATQMPSVGPFLNWSQAETNKPNTWALQQRKAIGYVARLYIYSTYTVPTYI